MYSRATVIAGGNLRPLHPSRRLASSAIRLGRGQRELQPRPHPRRRGRRWRRLTTRPPM